MRTFESEPMHMRDLPVADACDRQEPVAEVRLRRRADADARARVAQQVELAAVGMRGVHDRRPRAEAALAGEQLDRPEPVLGETFVDLARLLVGVHVQGQLVLRRVAAELAERLGRAGPHGVGGQADADAGVAQRLELAEVRGDRLLPEARDAAPQVAGVEADERDSGLARRRRRRFRLLEAEVVELADGRVAVLAQLAIDLEVLAADLRDAQRAGQGDHLVAPAPEVAAVAASPQCALKRMTVGVDESREGRHGHILSA